MLAFCRVGRVLLLCVLGILAWLPQSHAAAGRTAGAFAVSPTGAATYTIPIWAPPGPKGIQPDISLTYNSQSGNGYLGVGWTLGGLSSIYRCNLTYAQDTNPTAVALATTDGYCLDGQRLRLVSGTYGTDGSTYQTEIANFQNVTAHGTAGNGPAYFTVQTPDGRTLQYGNGGGSQVLASGSSTALSWMLNEVSDPAGNTMTISYSSATGTAVPSLISWTPTSHGASAYSYTMQFSYGTNVLPPSGYVAGTQVKNPNLLGSIVIKYNGTQVKEYALTYTQQPATTGTGRDVLTSVKECADSTSTCLSPTAITYQAGTAGVSASATSVVGSVLYNPTLDVSVRSDFNGDGYPDLLYRSGSTWYVAFGSASGYEAAVATPFSGDLQMTLLVGDVLGSGTDGVLYANGSTWYYYTWNGSAFAGVSTAVAYSSAVQYRLADIDGDGKPDLVAMSQSTNLVSLTTQRNTSSGSTPSFSTAVAAGQVGFNDSSGAALIAPGTRPGNPKFFDFNGDGRQDLVLFATDCLPEVIPGYGYAPCATEISEWRYLIAQPGGTFSIPVVFSSPASAAMGFDFVNANNDDCTDVVVDTPTSSTVTISGCDGNAASTANATYPLVGVMDWNGDGLTDLVENNAGTLYVQLATGTGFAAATATSMAYDVNCNYFAVDVRGDGLDDLGCASSASGHAGIEYFAHNSPGVQPDLVSSITDGYGNKVSPVYASAVQANHVTSGTFPDVSSVPSIPVVTGSTFSDPGSVSSTYSQSFQYTGSRRNLQGRGWEGFSQLQRTDSRNGLSDTQSFLTAFPYTGMRSQETLSSGSLTLAQAAGTQTVTTLSSTAGQQRYFPHFSNVTTKHWELGGTENGDLISTASTNYSYDNYGNATSTSTVRTDNDASSPLTGSTWTTTVTNTPDVDTTHWCLGLFSQTQTAYSTSTGEAAVTRTKQLTPDTTNCRYTQIITEPSSSTYKVTEALGYDSFGNVSSDAVTGVGMSARTTSLNWGGGRSIPHHGHGSVRRIYSFGL